MNHDKSLMVYGIYETRMDAERAVESLRLDGFRHGDISVLMPDTGETMEFSNTLQTKAPEGAAAGVATGAVVGGGLGWLMGIGALAIPGFGAFIAAGPIMAALAGLGVGGAVGGLTGTLVGMGIPDYEAKRYETQVREGGILVTIHCDDTNWAEQAKRVLEETGAHDVSSTSFLTGDLAHRNSPDSFLPGVY